MAKRIYGPGEPCDVCGTPTVQGKNGFYCKSCYIAWAEKKKNTWSNPQPIPQGTSQGNSEPYRGLQINKENSMRIMSSGRDAVLITVAQMAQGGAWDDDMVKSNIEKWNKYFFEKIYVDTPFKG